MSLYHTSFSYLNKKSSDEGFLVSAFEPDEGFTDAFLGMDQVSEDYYDGTKKFLYGTKFNTKATISITLIKADGTDLTVFDNRRVLKWLTGARTASWLDVYKGDEIIYSFLGTFTDAQQYKLDGRVIGISATFSSLTPWAFSEPQVFDCEISQLLYIAKQNGYFIVCKNEAADKMIVKNENGVYDGILRSNEFNNNGQEMKFKVGEDGTAYLENAYITEINNQSDDLYTYTYLDIDYQNDNGSYISIKNETLEEESYISNISKNEAIQISSKQFVISSIDNKIFGDTFNFVWPRLKPGVNDFRIYGDGRGRAKFTYRYPIKIGDCAMDISTYGGGSFGCVEQPSYDTVRWEDITGTPTSVMGYGIRDAYTKDEVEKRLEDIDLNVDMSIDEAALKNMLLQVLR